jgi:hypothetical protein
LKSVKIGYIFRFINQIRKTFVYEINKFKMIILNIKNFVINFFDLIMKGIIMKIFLVMIKIKIYRIMKNYIFTYLKLIILYILDLISEISILRKMKNLRYSNFKK